jgi:hypothetical protein
VPRSPLWDDVDPTVGSLRCYSPEDLRLLMTGTGLTVDAIEPYPIASYDAVEPLGSASFYLAKLVSACS